MFQPTSCSSFSSCRWWMRPLVAFFLLWVFSLLLLVSFLLLVSSLLLPLVPFLNVECVLLICDCCGRGFWVLIGGDELVWIMV
ncbi:hypothetical protein HanPSC8_Chr08g0318351 [Helianthus annuus]|nr:hypothetical protein HanIR_Chr08g0355531 [Helianthus annuus]KAJ0718481.1 hypothetical protein HanLR1_Chr08g0271031 [Helianthus annuus]KAJ0900842.1 hypothetical protein HanPSC8_Chr08g0318351 [Helianthus annuus]